ncbi:lysophospholipase L1-like esterase [Marinobacterium mangrovicola]|uniref:Lysophospholipase L1-like esterase n=2 Tax=Marinobacterium mangrovicola TaxID=1476959 RepID=A0A4R1GMG1_9GAMM|nr:lysophospholipase L1-like esterase [Marinobacterium mangrovicola]
MISMLRSLVLGLAVFVLAGCSDEKLSPLGDYARILAFGDSLTAGYGVSSEQSYPSVLAELSGREVINAGISGEETSEGVSRLATLLERESPELLILFEGGNDILRNRNLAQTKSNLAQMIEQARAADIQVMLVGVPQKSLFSSAAPFYAELAEEYDLAYLEGTVAELLREPAYKSDQVHFNAEGYRRLAQAIHDHLQQEGAL